MMKRLEEVGNKYEFPNTYVYYNNSNADKVTQFMKKFKYGDKIQCCMQSDYPVLNLNGSVCLKNKDEGDLLTMPNGSGDFYQASIKGVGIL